MSLILQTFTLKQDEPFRAAPSAHTRGLPTRTLSPTRPLQGGDVRPSLGVWKCDPHKL